MASAGTRGVTHRENLFDSSLGDPPFGRCVFVKPAFACPRIRRSFYGVSVEFCAKIRRILNRLKALVRTGTPWKIELQPESLAPPVRS